jgi:hypothetical protein
MLAIRPAVRGGNGGAPSGARIATVAPAADAAQRAQPPSPPPLSIMKPAQAVGATEPSSGQTEADATKEALAASLAEIILNVLSTRKFAARAPA